MADDKDPRGGHNRTKCVAITNDGHRCTKRAKPGRDLCGIHLRSTTPRTKPDTSTKTGKEITLLGELSVAEASVEDVKSWLLAVAAGEIRETQQTGGEGGTIDVPAKMRDRISAINLYHRITQTEGGGDSNAERVFDIIRQELGLE